MFNFVTWCFNFEFLVQQGQQVPSAATLLQELWDGVFFIALQNKFRTDQKKSLEHIKTGLEQISKKVKNRSKQV